MYFSITIMRPFKPGSQSRTLQVSRRLAYSLIGLITLSIFSILIGSAIIANKLLVIREYAVLKQAYNAQSDQLDSVLVELETLKTTIESLVDTQTTLQELVPQNQRRYLNKAAAKRINYYNQQFTMALKSPEDLTKLNTIRYKLDTMADYVHTLDQYYAVLYKKFQYYQDRFNHVPSIWPIHGYVRSRFGVRMHPILGRNMFHYGVDIPSWPGTPIRATADGVVLEAMFVKGLGLAVILDHGHGFKTIYAHASKFQVSRHDRVKKGQVIANVGATGLVTAPSLHYEVWRYRQRVDPMPYLNLTLVSAVQSVL